MYSLSLSLSLQVDKVTCLEKVKLLYINEDGNAVTLETDGTCVCVYMYIATYYYTLNENRQ